MIADRTRTIREPAPRAADDARPGIVILFSEAAIPGDGLYPAHLELTVGRSPDCGIFVEDPGLSRFHAVLAFDASGAATVRDGGSHNGSFLDGVRIGAAPVALAPRQILRCGGTLLAVLPDLAPYQGWRRWGSEGPLVGGPTMRHVMLEIAAFAPSDLEVLLTGESGTGKELVARELHRRSGRPGAFVAVNAAAVPEALFEAELFGARRGAFTGAVLDRPGLLQAAHQGTLFLDEVAELPVALQAKLLRVVEEREVRPLGGQQATAVELRLVAATNCDLRRAVSEGRLRADFLHRLRGALIHLSPLRERPADVPLLVEHLRRREGATEVAVSPAAMERLLLHRWPGNVRELDRVLREALARVRAAGELRLLPQHLREDVRGEAPAAPDRVAQIREALTRAAGNVSQAAAELGLHRAQIYALLREHNLVAEQFRGGR